MDQYQYDPLPPGSYLRLLFLEPGRGAEPLVCSLRAVHVDTMDFEAISYVWGTSTRDRDIICRSSRFSGWHSVDFRARRFLQIVAPNLVGRKRKGLKITLNLQEALRHLRLPDKTRRLWADSICINQEDGKERGHQVAMMGQIYSKARQVLIHLGPDNDRHGDSVKTLVDDVHGMIQKEYARIDPAGTHFSADSFPYPDGNNPLLTDMRWKDFVALLHVPWFTRGWVVQESGLAQRACLFWGTAEIDWLAFMRTAYWVVRRATFDTKYEPLIEVRNEINDLHFTTFTTLNQHECVAWHPPERLPTVTVPDMLASSRWLSLANPSDRVYAFMALGQRFASTAFTPSVPDYECVFTDVYLEFARDYLRSTGDLTLLNCIQHREETLTPTSPPSWVPRWDVDLGRSDPITDQRNAVIEAPVQAGGRSGDRPRVHCSDENVLRVRGVIFDTITTTSAKLSWDASPAEIVALWTDIFASSHDGITGPYGQDRALAFLQCLCCGMRAGSMEIWQHEREQYLMRLSHSDQKGGSGGRSESVAESTNETDLAENSEVQIVVCDFIEQRKALQTSKGYFGLGPGILRAGDVVAVIYGMRAPVVLREENREGQSCRYKILGDAYVVSGERTAEPNQATGWEYTILGLQDAWDWEDWGTSEEDILLV